jgi:hypothetical protein
MIAVFRAVKSDGYEASMDMLVFREQRETHPTMPSVVSLERGAAGSDRQAASCRWQEQISVFAKLREASLV